MRHIWEELNPFSGDIGPGKRLSLSVESGATYRSFYLVTNIPAQYFEEITLANGTDTPLSLSGDEVVMMEKHFKRSINPGVIPFHVSDIRANTLPGQDSLERPTSSRDAHELRVRLSKDLPAGSYYLTAWASFASPVEVLRDATGNPVKDGNGNAQLVPRVRQRERRFERHNINNVSKGVIVYDKLPRGVDLRHLYIKGDISKIEFEGRKNGSVVKRWELPRDVLEYIMVTEHDLAPQDGWLIFDAVGSGFMSDAMSTAYDAVKFKLHNESQSAQTIDIIADVVQAVA